MDPFTLSLIVYGVGILLHILIAVIQSKRIASGVTQIEENKWQETYEIYNGFLGIDFKPSKIIAMSPFWPLIWPIFLIYVFWIAVEKLDSPTSKKNKLIKEAEEEGLDLKEFVKSKKVKRYG